MTLYLVQTQDQSQAAECHGPHCSEVRIQTCLPPVDNDVLVKRTASWPSQEGAKNSRKMDSLLVLFLSTISHSVFIATTGAKEGLGSGIKELASHKPFMVDFPLKGSESNQYAAVMSPQRVCDCVCLYARTVEMTSIICVHKPLFPCKSYQ